MELEPWKTKKLSLALPPSPKKWNGRLAMLGFVIGVATELLTGQGILSQIGLM
jgi:hypothetical protein